MKIHFLFYVSVWTVFSSLTPYWALRRVSLPTTLQVVRTKRLYSGIKDNDSNGDIPTTSTSVSAPALNIQRIGLESTGTTPISSATRESFVEQFIIASASAAVSFVFGDLIAQFMYIFLNLTSFGYVRLIKFAVYGMVFYGPLGTIFRRFLSKSISGRSRKAVMAKVIIDQVLWMPFSLFVLSLYVKDVCFILKGGM